MCLKAWTVEVGLSVEDLFERMPSACITQGNVFNRAAVAIKVIRVPFPTAKEFPIWVNPAK